MPCRYGKADLVVQLRRCRYVAFLLDVESHASGPDQDVHTLRTDRLGDNSLVGWCPCADFCFTSCFRQSRPIKAVRLIWVESWFHHALVIIMWFLSLIV